MRRALPLLALLLLVPAASAEASVHRYVIGRSEQGRPIRAIERGDPAAPRRLLVFGLIHGNEPAGRAIARRLASTTPPPGLDVWVVEDLNPDGFAAHTRQNGRGVDLNRNFGYRWRHLDHPGGTFWSGTGPLSESESRAARALILRVRPTVTVWYHQHLDVVDLSGGDEKVERRYAGLVGMRTAALPRYPGSATSWQNHAFPGTTAFVVELAAGMLSPGAVTRHMRALFAVAS
jgi:protein MpaA